MRVLIASNIDSHAIERMEKEGLEVDVMPGLDEEELERIIENYDALVVRSSPKVTARIIDKAKKLKIIGRAGVGVDNIDVNYATQKGIVVVNAPGGNTVSTAELTIGMILAAARKIPQADKSVKEGRWERKKFVGKELRGKTIGIIGLGRIGYEVAKRARAFEMNVIAYDPYISEARAREVGVRVVDLDELVRNADIITVHVPKTKETENLIDEDEFEKMKDGVIVINCARGGIINEKALINALKSGKIYAAALDVYETEPPDFDSELFGFDNVVTTPHIGASTKEAQEIVGMIIAEDIINMLHGYPVKNAVNLPSLSPEDFEFLMPYLKLAEKMGKIAAARLSGNFERVKITYRGKLAGKDTSYLSRAVLKGLLEYILGPNINLVSAPPIAKERGIEVEESKIEKTDSYESIIEMEVLGRNGSIYIAGTSFGRDDYRVIRIDKYKVDFVPEGHYIISLHEDKPGVIGRVGTLFGRNSINIAGMIVGRHGNKPGGIQLMLLLVDDPPSDEVLEEMEKLDGILDATYICL
ncbi:phosphoglycerate dehydrogenase [Geoglobus acetivorans]|uniref:D-3-phosphoglycerate dehydrogenase n=1 Tax=Geoglobus acetivorans TaxID=565033 RepID=A0A0A7GC76_GEOAI|nr:phosphoglycerate dehydrogenase [Geoglobus acetivorans]